MIDADSVLHEPGMYLGVTDREYHSLIAASNSNLGTMNRSAAHLKWSFDNPRTTTTAAFTLGSAAHSAILEPEIFVEEYVMGPEGDKRKKIVKEEWVELEEKYGMGFVLKQSEFLACEGMRDAVMNHQAASDLLYASGDSEVTLIWDDPATGVRCKARIDRLPHDGALGVGDLKTTKDASKRAFAKSLWAYGYHRQAAHYLNGLEVLGYKRHGFTFVAVEKEPPYGVAVYAIDSGSIDAGDHQLKRLLQEYKQCNESGVWPAYPTTTQDIAIPPWAFSELDKE